MNMQHKTAPKRCCIYQLDQFLMTKVSHGNVVTYLSCGGIFNHLPIANLPASPLVKEF